MTMKKNIAKQMNISVNRLSQILNYKREAKGHEIIDLIIIMNGIIEI